MAVLVPMPRARAATAAIVKPGFFKRLRRECLRSCHRLAKEFSFPALGFDCLDGAAPKSVLCSLRKCTLPYRKCLPLKVGLSLCAKAMLSPTGVGRLFVRKTGYTDSSRKVTFSARP